MGMPSPFSLFHFFFLMVKAVEWMGAGLLTSAIITGRVDFCTSGDAQCWRAIRIQILSRAL